MLVTGDEEEFLFKLCDVGHGPLRSRLATSISLSASNTKMKLGTMSFEAPEVFIKGKKSVASDIYSFAMVMH